MVSEDDLWFGRIERYFFDVFIVEVDYLFVSFEEVVQGLLFMVEMILRKD